MTFNFTTAIPNPADFKNLYDTTGWGPFERDKLFYEQALQASWTTCSAYAGNQLVGFGRVISDGRLHAFITEMIIAPKFQSQGIGLKLLDQLVAHCLKHGVTDIQLFCAEGKADFYTKGGFVPRLASRPGMQYARPQA
jgi:ribosomal protein S18 acetylase RimI-like enzyme